MVSKQIMKKPSVSTFFPFTTGVDFICGTSTGIP